MVLLRISEMCGVTLRKDTHALLQSAEPLASDFEAQCPSWVLLRMA
jgi:hypothetical protein